MNRFRSIRPESTQSPGAMPLHLLTEQLSARPWDNAWDIFEANCLKLFRVLGTTSGLLVGRPGLDSGTLGLKEGCV